MQFGIATILIVIGLVVLILPTVIEHRRIWIYGMPVCAKIYNIEDSYVIWRYEYDGQEYFHRSNRQPVKKDRYIGYEGALLLKKENPAKVYKFMTDHQRLAVRIIGLIIIIIGILSI